MKITERLASNSSIPCFLLEEHLCPSVGPHIERDALAIKGGSIGEGDEPRLDHMHAGLLNICVNAPPGEIGQQAAFWPEVPV